MKTRCLMLFLALFLGLSSSAFAQDETSSASKYWIFFKDKMTAAGKATVVEPDYLTDYAQKRRALRGTDAAVSSMDAPVSPDYLNTLRHAGIEPLVQSRWLNAVSVYLTEKQVALVRKQPFVKKIQPVAAIHPQPEMPHEGPDLSAYQPSAHKTTLLDYGQSQVQLNLVNAIPALERGINGKGVRFGILDTEYGDFTHPVFKKMKDEGRIKAYQNFTGRSQTSRHGMAVSSIAFGFLEGQLIGPAYGADVYAATTEYAPTETNQEEDNFVAGMEWLERQGVDVVNSSLGYSEFDAGQRSYTIADLNGDIGITTRISDLAAQRGVAVVTSAGNEGAGAWRFITTPADGDSVIAVGAVTSARVKASFSSVGPTADGRIKPDVSAMGASVYHASGSAYASGGGTSYSSPMVAGVVAQMLQVNPRITPMQVRDILRETASLATSPNNDLGWGIIDANAAILRAEVLALGIDPEVPVDALEVDAAYPNPFTSQTRITIRMPKPGTGRLVVYNLLGQQVDVPFEGTLVQGANAIDLKANSLSAGVYFYQIETSQGHRTGKIVLVR